MSAIRLLVEGNNPYDHPQLFKMQAEIVDELAQGIAMWNPPLIAVFLLPFLAFDFKFSLGLLRLFTLGTVLFCFYLVSSSRLNKAKNQGGVFIWSALFLMTFYPPISAMQFGQISFLLLLGLSGFLWSSGLMAGDDYKDSYLAGLSLSATLIKPHILFLLYFFLAADFFKRLHFRTILGLLTGAVLLTGFPLLFNPEIYQQYFATVRTPPIYFKTPTLGSWLQDLTQMHNPVIRSLPSFIALVVFTFVFFRKPLTSLPCVMLVLPLSLVFSPYGWLFDQILLLPVGLILIANSVKQKNYLIPFVLLMGNVSIFLIPGELGQQIFLYWPILLSALVYYSYFFKHDNFSSSGRLLTLADSPAER
jgi:hypothetical protein